MKRRIRAAGIHLLVSLCVAALTAATIFLVWFPAPLATIAGGLNLFGLLVAIDVVLGPLLTGVVASPGKPFAELRRDILCIAAVQLAAFAYGIHSIAQARPVLLVLQENRLVVVTAADIIPGTLERATPAFRELSWTGPRLVAVRGSTKIEETRRSLDLAVQGVGLSQQPERWVDYATQKEQVLKTARPAQSFAESKPAWAARLAEIARSSGTPVAELRGMQMTGRRGTAIAVVAPPDARIVGYLVDDLL